MQDSGTNSCTACAYTPWNVTVSLYCPCDGHMSLNLYLVCGCRVSLIREVDAKDSEEAAMLALDSLVAQLADVGEHDTILPCIRYM